MPVEVISIEHFLDKAGNRDIPVIDTRSENEYAHAHIPGALNLPLLNNEERIVVGTVYRQKGREAAVLKGFELVGPRFHQIIKKATELTSGKEVLIYCWRGGMRSNITAWVLSLYGFKVCLLKGGYKSFRNYVLEVNSIPGNVIVLGGPTGSGKTDLLLRLAAEGEQVLDLEGLANHKGSAFGGLGQPKQPSNEQFENLVAMRWRCFESGKVIWIENESRSIGSCLIPDGIYSRIRDSIVININVPHEQRVKRITEEYGSFPFETLAETTLKIKKRLGPQHLKYALECLEQNDFNGWLDIILKYYDKLYSYGNEQRDPKMVHNIDLVPFQESEYTRVLKNTSSAILENTTNINIS